MNGDDLRISSRMAALLFDALGVERLRVELRGRSEELDSTLWRWREVAIRERQRALSSILGTKIASSSDVDASSPVMTAAQVAEQAALTTRAVTKAATQGRLPGRRIAGVWLFDRTTAEAWAEERRIA